MPFSAGMRPSRCTGRLILGGLINKYVQAAWQTEFVRPTSR
jgi:hypothetical protein